MSNKINNINFTTDSQQLYIFANTFIKCMFYYYFCLFIYLFSVALYKGNLLLMQTSIIDIVFDCCYFFIFVAALAKVISNKNMAYEIFIDSNKILKSLFIEAFSCKHCMFYDLFIINVVTQLLRIVI